MQPQTRPQPQARPIVPPALPESAWANRVKQLTLASPILPALVGESEAALIRKRYTNVEGALKALEDLADQRLAYLNVRDNLPARRTLSEAQFRDAEQFFAAPAQSAESPAAPTPAVAPATPPTPTKPEKSPGQQLLEAQTALLKDQNKYLARIADALEQLARASAPKAPNYQRALTDFPAFDWSTIGAVVKSKDSHGASAVEWNDYVFTRRSGEGKFGEAIWFSRPTGKDAEGNNTYARLVTFKNPTDAEPLAKKVAAKV